jgi:hypothetical protein
MPKEETPAKFRARIIDENRAAFDLWRHTCALVEGAIPTPRDISDPYARALDLLFIQGYKSFSSLYVLCVRGQGEDAATILRRLLEISLQAGYLANDPEARELRGKQYLAYYWAQVPDLLKTGLDVPTRERLNAMYEAHKHLLAFDRRGRPSNWWSGTIRDLADRLGLLDTYDQDYTFLSQMAHGTTQGILLEIRSEGIEIRSDRMVREILVFGCRYILGLTLLWNERFNLVDEKVRTGLSSKALGFDFRR